ncbi:DMT family transporter [Pseudarthrobacter sp. J64]|uniref:DMT family transporter n=1 Tax=Pseudarthrobacter sp. J64 TaxID=3116485 RepID=UPI002E812A86|nr:DMT family transporter [Pseudarthrobacter sp. J64]MEE2568923.1 DMT family transporter [Pseudarthrobacter sp. J64]
MASVPQQRLLGYLAMGATVAIWAAFALSVRGISLSALTPIDVALIRFGVPVLLFLWWLRRAARDVRLAPKTACLLVIIGAGLPFFLLSTWGGSLSSATMVGVVIPGAAPLFVTLIGRFFLRQAVPRRSVVGLILITLGITTLAAAAPSTVGPQALAVLVLAGLLWALYTLGLKGAGLHPITATLLLCIPSLIGTAAVLALGWGESHLATAPLEQTAGFIAVQGLGVGAIAGLSYAAAIRTIGPAAASSIGATSPALVTILAVPVFGEPISLISSAAVALVVSGVLIVNAKKSAPRKKEQHVLEPA